MGKTAAIASTSPDPIELLRRARATLRVLEGADGGRSEVLSRLVDRLCEATTRPGARVVRRTSRCETVQDALVAVDAELRRLRRAISGNGSLRRSSATTRAHLFGGRTPVRSKAGYQCEVRTVLAAIATLDGAPPAVLAMVPRLQAVLARLDATSPATPGRRPTGPRSAWSPEVHRAARNLHVALGEVLSEAAADVELHTLERLERLVLAAPRRERKLAGSLSPVTSPRRDHTLRDSCPHSPPAGRFGMSWARGEWPSRPRTRRLGADGARVCPRHRRDEMAFRTGPPPPWERRSPRRSYPAGAPIQRHGPAQSLTAARNVDLS